MNKQAGFTIMEMMVVIAIIGILSAIGIPNLVGKINDAGLTGASSHIRSDLQAAKLSAIRLNREFAIFFNAGAGNFSLVNSGADGIFNGTPLPQGDDQIVRTKSLTDFRGGVTYGHGNAGTNATAGGGAFPGDNISYTNNTITFNARGMALNTGFVYLQNTNNNRANAIGVTSRAGVITQRYLLNGVWN